MLEFAFMDRALAAALIIGVLCGVLGFFVVLKKLAFIGIGISHAAIGGVALGIILGFNPLLTAAAFAIAVALGISATSRRSKLAEDVVIGVFFSGSMALGLALLSLERGYQQDLFAYLFGDVLAISPIELTALAALSLITLGVLAVAFRELLFVAFDEEIARAYGHPVDRLNTLLLVLLALTVIVGVRLVGILLIEALLVVPAATAALWANNFRPQLLASALLGAACGIAGLWASYRFDVAAGAAIAVVAVAAFFVSLLLRARAV